MAVNNADLFELDVDLVFWGATAAWFETGDEDVASPFGWRSPPTNPSAA